MTTFRRRTVTNDDLTDVTTIIETEITGSAIKVRGDPKRYQAMGLVLQTMPTLFFTPDTYGDTPEVGDVVEWPPDSEVNYTVRDVETVAPDNVTIAARVVIGQ